MQDVHGKLNCGLLWHEQHPTRRKLFSPAHRLKFKEETSIVLHLEHSLCGVETATLWKVDQKYLKTFEMWCWRRMEEDQLDQTSEK
jgi:hypothetical protein